MARRPIEISKVAHDAALHFLAQPKKYGLTDAVGRDLTEVVEGYTGRCDETAARRGMEWMREHTARRARHRAFETGQEEEIQRVWRCGGRPKRILGG
jgi:hypothetical protein